MLQGTLIEKSSYDLGLKVAANIPTCGIPIEVQRFYLANPDLIPEALVRGFVLPQKSVARKESPARLKASAASVGFKTADTDLAMWIEKTEEYFNKYLGIRVSIRKIFKIPETLLWQSAIPIFDPGGDFDNRKAVELLQAIGLNVYEESDVVQYSGSEANNEPRLWLINNSITPDFDTMGMSADTMVATGKNFLDLRGYALAFGLYHFVTKNHLDPKTFTRFPKNRLPSGKVANSNWNPDNRKVRFNWNNTRNENPNSGARLEISG